jgi:cellobiose-specific phosphotransferase system component IIC
MITTYIIGFFITFVLGAIYNQRCKVENEIPAGIAVIASLIWPVTLLALVIAVLYDIFRKIFDSISKK